MIRFFCKLAAVVLGVTIQLGTLFALFVIHVGRMPSPWLATAMILIMWYVLTCGVKGLYRMPAARVAAPRSQSAIRQDVAQPLGGSMSNGDDIIPARKFLRTPGASGSRTDDIINEAMNSPAMQAWRAQRAPQAQE